MCLKLVSMKYSMSRLDDGLRLHCEWNTKLLSWSGDRIRICPLLRDWGSDHSDQVIREDSLCTEITRWLFCWEGEEDDWRGDLLVAAGHPQLADPRWRRAGGRCPSRCRRVPFVVPWTLMIHLTLPVGVQQQLWSATPLPWPSRGWSGSKNSIHFHLNLTDRQGPSAFVRRSETDGEEIQKSIELEEGVILLLHFVGWNGIFLIRNATQTQQ